VDNDTLIATTRVFGWVGGLSGIAAAAGACVSVLGYVRNWRRAAVLRTMIATALVTSITAICGVYTLWAGGGLRDVEAKQAAARIRAAAPRSLSASQIDDVSASLRPFAAINLMLVTMPEKEPSDLSRDMLRALGGAQWIVSLMIGHDRARAVTGLLVEIKPGATDAETRAAKALAAAIGSQGLTVEGPIAWNEAAMSGSFTSDAPPPHNVNLRLTIGTK
jgi:hypothetical protein